MTFNSLLWFDQTFLSWLCVSLLLNFALISLWQKGVHTQLGIKKYRAVQRIHLEETPRLGGLLIILCLIGYLSINTSVSELRWLVVSLLPLMVFSLKEDLFHNVRPMLRLLSLFLTSLLFICNYEGVWPVIDLPILGDYLSAPLGILLFYPIAMASISNGMNLIDGVNGLCASTALSIFASLLFLSHVTGDTTYMMLITSLMLLLIIFLIFNYPLGKIFLGDLGAYSLGMLSSMLTILFYAHHPEVPTWGAVLVLIYPATEVIFSVVRRLKRGVSLHKPDTEHLHMKLFVFLRAQSKLKKMANPLVTPTLTLVWIFPLIVLPWVYKETALIFLAMTLFVFIYMTYYVLVGKLKP